MKSIKLQGPDSVVKTQRGPMDKQAQLRKNLRKEGLLKQAIKTPSGLKKIAAALSKIGGLESINLVYAGNSLA